LTTFRKKKKKESYGCGPVVGFPRNSQGQIEPGEGTKPDVSSRELVPSLSIPLAQRYRQALPSSPCTLGCVGTRVSRTGKREGKTGAGNAKYVICSEVYVGNFVIKRRKITTKGRVT